MTKNVSSYNRVLHYIPPVQAFADLPKEYVIPTESDSFIHWLYRYRCAKCRKPGTEVNEIIPRSRSRYSVLNWKNRVLLCSMCHHEFHHNGVTNEKIKSIKDVQKEYLMSVGREEYAQQL